MSFRSPIFLIGIVLPAGIASAAATDLDTARRDLGVTETMRCVRAIGGAPDIEWRRVDLNGDGEQELIMLEGAADGGASSCYGVAGRAAHVMMRTDIGRWQSILDVDALDLTPTHGGRNGWSDLEAAGSGSCLPTFRFQDDAYQPTRNCR